MSPENPRGSRKERIRARRSEKTQSYHPNHKTRNLLMGTGALSLAILVAAGICYSQVQSSESNLVNNPENIFIQAPEATYQFGTFSYDIVSLEPTQTFDKQYLESLLNNLHTDRGDRLSRTRAVVNHFTHIGTSAGGSGSALQIDESGIYLTAAHVFTHETGSIKPEKFYVHTPKVDKRMLQTESGIFMDWETDLAIVFAPTGKPRKAVENIVLKDELAQGGNVWLLGTSDVTKDYTFLGILKGIVDHAAPYVKPGKNLVSVTGMKPFGGSSGGPLIDNEGRVVGVESGKLVAEGNSNDPNIPRSQYTGAAISPLSYLKELITRPISKLRGLR